MIATTKITNSKIAEPLEPRKPEGVPGVMMPVTCKMIPIKPMIEPPAIKPEDKLTPKVIRSSATSSVYFLFNSSIKRRINAPTKMIDVVEIGR